MRIAVAYENNQVSQHFGHTERFKIYDIENNEVVLATTVNTDGSGHGALADILKKLKVNALICGGIGSGARRALQEAGIALYGGVSGSADKAVEALIQDKLNFDPDIVCNHEGEHHGDNSEKQSCGHHSR